MKNFDFIKMNGCGNDFIVCNYSLEDLFPDELLKDKIISLCDRRFGIGADGLISILTSQDADCQMIIYNSDGSRAEMCGNGLRCAVVYAGLYLNLSSEGTVQTDAGCFEISLDLSSRDVSVEMVFDRSYQSFSFDVIGEGYLIHTGVPHLVFFVEDVEKIDVEKLGSLYRFSDNFKPYGTNVNFVQIVSDKQIRIRTYERGVEAETWACGTGATASAFLAYSLKNVAHKDQDVEVLVKGGRMFIKVEANSVYMRGSANIVYRGECDV